MQQLKKVSSAVWQFAAAEWMGYGLVFLVPLFVWRGSFFPYTSPKSLLIFFLVALLGFLYVWGKVRNRASFALSWLHLTLGAFLLVLTASAAFGVNPRISFFGTFIQGTSVALLYVLGVFAVVIAGLIRRNERFLSQLLAVSLAAASMVALLTHGKNIGGPLGNDSYTGPYLLINACIGIGLALVYSDVWKKIAAALGVLVIVTSPVLLNLNGSLAHPLTMLGSANGAAIGLGLSAVVFVLFLLIRSQKRVWQYIGGAAFVLFLIAVFAGGKVFMNPHSSLHQRYVAEKSDNRFLFWDIAAAGFNARPLLGWGYANYDRVYQEYFDPIFYEHGYTPEGAIREPHNIVWEYLSTTGAAGLIVYLMLLGGVVIVLFMASREGAKKVLYLALAASIVGYFFQNLFFFDTPAVYMMYFLLAGVALSVAPLWKAIPIPQSKTIDSLITVVVGVVGAGAVVILVLQPMSESRAMFNLLTKPDISPAHLQERSLMGGVDDIAHIAGKFYSGLTQHFATANDVQKKKYVTIVNNLVTVLQDSINREHGSYRAPLITGTLIDSLVTHKAVDNAQTSLQGAEGYLRSALDANPRNPVSYFTLALNTFYQAKFSLAYTYMKAGIVLAPSYDQGYAISATLLKVVPNKSFEAYIGRMKTATSSQ